MVEVEAYPGVNNLYSVLDGKEPGTSELLFVSAKRMSRIPNCHQLMGGRPQVTFQLICTTETGMGDWQTDSGIKVHGG